MPKLSDLGSAIINVEITLPYGRQETIAIGTMSMEAWLDADKHLVAPDKPPALGDKDPVWREKMDGLNRRRMAAKLLAALDKVPADHPNKLSIGDGTSEEREMRLLRELDAGVFWALYNNLSDAIQRARASTSAAVQSFRSES